VKIHNDRYAVKSNIGPGFDAGIHMSRSEKKLQTRQRILQAAGRGFRRGGYDGLGVDGLAKEAGVTSGAFYVHFASKAAAFRESVVEGVSDVVRGVQHFQAEHGKDWWGEFVRFYLAKRKCDLSESCGLQSLTPEVARADAESRNAFTTELLKVGQAIIAGPKSLDAPRTIEEAQAALATLIGAVTLARAVDDPVVARKIAAAAERALVTAHEPGARSAGTKTRR
jgi:TetR/AcrR family transcriptional regulator, transcriptional repressor for nem operon